MKTYFCLLLLNSIAFNSHFQPQSNHFQMGLKDAIYRFDLPDNLRTKCIKLLFLFSLVHFNNLPLFMNPVGENK
ncbi:hypothetical protein FBFR_12020 [Flavobacterium fryxellicola]|uniref:Uncharacterized protein n=1 Tax=Flavobacterium fryxellicola TaxID=249352 RepID=A0A167WDG8_9FLAO|nr:hypothetical protein FBFR_12020 [Flavobacterium fryxellicola]